MAVRNTVLYGPRLYASSTYANNDDPESLSLSLTDSTTLTDPNIQFLADALALLETRIQVDSSKPLADSIAMTETLFVQALKLLVDSLSAQDATIRFQQIKGLSDFVALKDWIEIKLQRAGIWSVSPAFGTTPSEIHLYGPGVYYGVDFYGANPKVNWLVSTPDSTIWQGTAVATEGETLYGQTLYGQMPYGSVPAGGWTKPNLTTQQAWENANGESHN